MGGGRLEDREEAARMVQGETVVHRTRVGGVEARSGKDSGSVSKVKFNLDMKVKVLAA